MGSVGTGWDEISRGGMGSAGIGWDGIGWDGTGWDGIGWDGIGSDRNGLGGHSFQYNKGCTIDFESRLEVNLPVWSCDHKTFNVFCNQ